MNTAQPIKKTKDLENIKQYYHVVHPSSRNALLITMGLYTALRISDILELQWKDVYDERSGSFKSHIYIVEQKTGKRTQIFMNRNICEALEAYRNSRGEPVEPMQYLFCHSNKNIPISRVQAFRIIKKAAEYYNLSEVISCHSLRKTFGYHAWKQGVPPALLVNIFNHSSYEITKRYLGIEQDDRDRIFEQIQL